MDKLTFPYIAAHYVVVVQEAVARKWERRVRYQVDDLGTL
jgi:hypothetical protein